MSLAADSFAKYVDDELRHRLAHRAWTEKPYEECQCSQGGPCEPIDPNERQVLRGLAVNGAEEDCAR